MKKIFKTVPFTVTISLFFILAGCSKSVDSNTTVNFTKTQLLTKADWIQTGSDTKLTTETVWTDNFARNSACSKDDRIVFRANGTFEINEGPTKCSPSDPQIQETGTWSFAQNETVFFITISGQQSDNFTIVTLTTDLLVFTRTDTYNGITREFKETFRH